MEIAFLFAGLPFVAVGVLIVVSEVRARRGAAAVSGTIVGFSTGTRDGYYHCVAEYVALDGVSRYIESSIGSSAPLGAVGDNITVLLKEGHPEQASIQSPLSYVLGVIVAAMGIASCAVFFVTFRATTLSIAGAAVVTALTTYQLLGAKRSKSISLDEWREKRNALRPRVYTEANKSEIRWADRETVDAAIARQQKANRFAIPILLVAGVGLLVLGAYLHRSTEAFLAKALPAEGRVVDLAASDSSDSTTYAPVVEFEVNDRTYRFRDSVGSNPPSYRRGDEVKVLYDPDRPSHARIDRGRWNRAVPLLVGAFGALL
ncbi:MAG TPA: DUF3592 domain-containing protein, partial [Myxococcales bacterium]|nr:DUF3592 domain-containing protein [Myxococcales bacterium]